MTAGLKSLDVIKVWELAAFRSLYLLSCEGGGPVELQGRGTGKYSSSLKSLRNENSGIGQGALVPAELSTFPFLIQFILGVGKFVPQNYTVTAYHFCLF